MKYIIFVWLNQNTEIMNTTIFTAEIDSAEMPKISAILKELKGKFIKIEEKEDTYSSDFAQKLRQARAERKRGETIKISSENLWKISQ